jgi:transcriptional regulator with XRE-family HTH domain
VDNITVFCIRLLDRNPGCSTFGLAEDYSRGQMKQADLLDDSVTRKGKNNLSTIERDNQISEVIGLKPSMVYKIRRGERFPSFKTMLKIEEVTNWSVHEQVLARKEGSYATKFENAIAS